MQNLVITIAVILVGIAIGSLFDNPAGGFIAGLIVAIVLGKRLHKSRSESSSGRDASHV